MKLIEEFADLAEIIGGHVPGIDDPNPGNGSPTYRTTNPKAWDYD